MDLELIQKFIDEFSHWIKGGRIFVKYKSKDTYVEEEGMLLFTMQTIDTIDDIVIYDNHTKYIVALKQGKTVQAYNLDVWYDVTTIDSIKKILPKYLRVKPDIKIGEWRVATLKNSKPFKVTQKWIDTTLNYKDFKKWEPKKGDWIWVFNSEDDFPLIRKFREVHNGKCRVYSHMKENLECNNYIDYKYCSPFIGELPSNLKGN